MKINLLNYLKSVIKENIFSALSLNNEENISIYKNHRRILRSLRQKVKNKEKINVGFFIVYDSVFPAEKLFNKMLQNDLFNAFIVVIPDIKRGDENKFYQLNKTYNNLSKKYKKVYSAYDEKLKKFINFRDKCDLVCMANPYDTITDTLYTNKYISEKCLTFFIPYAFFVTSYIENFIAKNNSLKYFWKIFIEAKENKKYYFNNNLKNIKVSGYPRVDNLSTIPKDKKRIRKKIIIATHSVSTKNNHGIEFAQFLNFYDVFLELPEKYPDIDFVFRPHPLQYTYLKRDGIWSDKEIEEYINTLKSYPNLTYQDGGDFAYDFVNSDGIIHDCGSFLPEYLITGHPTCYLMDKKEIYDKYFTDLGKKCLDNCYIADNKQKIYDFIDNVVIQEKDYLYKKRLSFINKYLKFNYGKVTEFIIKYIKKELKV